MVILLLLLQKINMSKKLFTVIFLLILSLGVFMRFYKLGDIPNSLDWDEVSQGYNAYSILTTGRDEFGTAFPSTIRSFNDYKPPVYVYLTTLSVGVFGLSPFSARLLSALFGSLSIILVFLLVYEILRKEKFAKSIALLSMLFLAISPYSIQFSRTGFDANVGVFFVILGTWLFVRGLNFKSIWQILLGTLVLGISAYTAHSGKVFTPLFFLCLVFYGRKYFLSKKAALVGILVFFAFLNIFWFFDSQTRARSSGVLFTSSQNVLKTSVGEMAFDNAHGDYWDAFIHNRRFVYFNKYIENYLSHFDPNSLFVSGDNARHHAPGMGILYLTSLPFILIGVFFVIRRKIYPAFIFFAWILLAPVASAFAIDAPNFQRSLIFLPTFHVFEALGWFYLFSVLSRVKFFRILMAIIVIIFSFNVFYYFHQYFAYTNSEYGQYWQFGYKETIDFTRQYTKINKKIFFAKDMEQAYVFYLFYNKYDPRKYLASGGSNRINPNCYSIDNAYFGTCKNVAQAGDIFVTSKTPSPNLNVIKTINDSNSKTAVWVLEHL
jgi:4-amino-4-deoxy-L-arabinose transferase-like glycosyltransferase